VLVEVALGSIVEPVEVGAEGEPVAVGDVVDVELLHPAMSTIVVTSAVRARDRWIRIGTLLPSVRGLPSEVI
jgi:hypothetical protein